MGRFTIELVVNDAVMGGTERYDVSNHGTHEEACAAVQEYLRRLKEQPQEQPPSTSAMFLNPLLVLKAICAKTGLGLKEAKDLTDLIEIVGLTPLSELTELHRWASRPGPEIQTKLRYELGKVLDILRSSRVVPIE